MVHSSNVLLLPIKCIFICVLIAADAFLILLLVSSVQVLGTPAYAKDDLPATQANRTFANILNKNIKNTSHAIGSTVASAATNVGNTMNATAHTISDTVSNVTTGIAATITDPETIIKPEPAHKTPEIEPVAQPVAITPPPNQTPPPQPTPPVTPAAAAPPPAQSVAIWPLKGAVTTEFGVYHQPFQARHTGMDIASGQPVGRAAVTPFKEGTVISAGRSANGLGNHIIIDHGSGVTSWYGHLSSIAVTTGQAVKPGDVIGYEGRTGTATGPHLHFEIHQNGTPLNPRKFIGGSP